MNKYVITYSDKWGNPERKTVEANAWTFQQGFVVFYKNEVRITTPYGREMVTAIAASSVDSVEIKPEVSAVSEISIDGKFSTDGRKIFNTVSREVIPRDEPLFLLRSRDLLAWSILEHYYTLALKAGCNDLHLSGIQQVMKKFAWFCTDHPERMKQPGITRHLKLEEEAPQTSKVNVEFGTCEHLSSPHSKSIDCSNWVPIAVPEKHVSGLWRNNPATKEGKYLVKRRDGTVVEYPNFVLGARDPAAPEALRAYADKALELGFDQKYVNDVLDLAASFEIYLAQYGSGDPDRGPHRKDDPKTIEEMRGGRSA